ncbi:MAG TPA: hypothetical protein VN911_10410 [Candidatus Acidoferrum sp.]|nr:hypothetical protein [Candidatus Acidoferrum sp.]
MFQTCRPAGRLIYLVLVVALSLRVAAREDGSGSKMERSAVSAGARPTGTRAMPRAASPTPQGGPTLTSVVDTVYLADGTTAHGVLVITWPAFVEASGSAVSEGSLNVTLGTNGALNVALAPNAGANPPGVYYTVVYQLGPGQVKTEFWVVPTSSPATLAQVRTTPGNGVAAPGASEQYVNTALATKANDNAVVHLAGTETISGNKPGADKKDAAMSFLQNALAMTDAIAAREIVNPEEFRDGISKIIDGTVECLNASTWCKQTPSANSQPSA